MHNKIPKHVGIIMDGNGRWAEKRGRPRFFGHIKGSSRVHEIVEAASTLGIRALTLYAFSTENWKRPEEERAILWRLLVKHLRREKNHLNKNNVRLRVMGQLERLPVHVINEVKEAELFLSKNTGLILTFAVSYGSRAEILDAAKKWANDALSQQRIAVERNESHSAVALNAPTEAEFSKYLWTSDLGEYADLDLVIRTSNEYRISNFLLWQAAYAEFFFVPEYWPDFTAARFRDVIDAYGKRERRIGNVSAST